MGVNSLRKTVTRQRRDCDLNPGPSAPESSTLTTRLPGVHVNNMKKRTCLFLNSLSATFTLQVDKTLTRRRHISSCAMPSRSHRHYDDDTRQLSAAAAAFKIFVTSMASIEDRHRRRLGAAGSLVAGAEVGDFSRPIFIRRFSICCCNVTSQHRRHDGVVEFSDPRSVAGFQRFCEHSPSQSRRLCDYRNAGSIGNESVPIQMAQCWFHGLAISNIKYKYIFRMQ